ncbi:hypothetical protein [Amniculibacterium aquaticum]|uniref:hypothetical protein n=1 Tax=Amniculibacterium aquaticum TaxID=2479858 RepID=UPI000F5AA56A|nr:hypothetical protein [Amniculibacterium aquaticum]
MNKEQINIAKNLEILKLYGWRYFTHFQIFYMVLIIPIMIFLVKAFKFNNFHFSQNEFYLYFALGIVCALLYFMQKKKLKFKTIKINNSKEKILECIEKVAEKLKWYPEEITDEYIIAKTRPSFFSGSWGEEITIVFDGNKILINSICDPDKQSSVVSMGRNKKNVNILINEIKNACR